MFYPKLDECSRGRREEDIQTEKGRKKETCFKFSNNYLNQAKY